jgi:hypothetical protein
LFPRKETPSNSFNINKAIAVVAPLIAITIIAYFIFIPNPDPELCKKIDLGWAKLEQCKSQVRSEIEQVVTNNLPLPIGVPGNVSEVNERVEANTGNITSRPLNSIVGSWLVSGNTSAQQQFAASFTFESSNQYSSIVNLNGSLSPPLFGKYIFSPIQEKFSLQPYGGTVEEYKIVETTSDSFKVNGASGTMTFVRVSPRN